MGKTSKVLELKNIRKCFNDRIVLEDISLDIFQNEVICMIGESGCGKSTLLKCINLLESIDDGQIILDGQDISDPRINPDKVRSQIGVVFQQFNLFPHMTVLDNVTIGLHKVFKHKKHEAEEIAMQMLERIGLSDKAKKHPDSLSGGEQQRVAIVRAIATSPKLLLLDEITSALDPRLVNEVLQLVLELKDSNTTIFMATHEMSFAKKVSDKIVFLHCGRIAEDGRSSEILTSPKTAELQRFLESEGQDV